MSHKPLLRTYSRESCFLRLHFSQLFCKALLLLPHAANNAIIVIAAVKDKWCV